MTAYTHLRDALLSAPRVRITGAGTKPALSTAPADAVALDLSGCRGLTEYHPGEFTFTARAGTPVEEIQHALAANGQYLPFDPPLADRGATLGGTIAAGLNGSSRLRYGGLRDFILGVTFLTGDGRFIRGGGKVVKNAAGFDFPKLLVGSCGRLGVMLEATFKVFPLPQERLTAAAETGSLAAALALAARLVRLPADLDAFDFEPGGRVLVRLAGDHGTLETRLRRLSREAGAAFAQVDESCWLHSPLGATLSVKVPVTPARVPELDAALAALGLPRRYAVAGQVAWIGLAPGQEAGLDAALRACRLGGLSLHTAPARLGTWPSAEGEALLRRVFDPDERLV
jgi:glycolate oxidase FAD binding subunit